MDGVSGAKLRGSLVCHCLLVETAKTLALVDTGYGLRDVAAPRSRLNPVFLALMRPDLREEMTAVRQIAALGFNPSDVRHVVLTHLDFDHAGGLDDFPEAEVHLLAREHAAAKRRRTMLDRMRYRPQQWSTEPNWRTYEPNRGDTWLGFEGVQSVPGLTDEVLLVPLHGHTLGHAGVAVRRERDWLLQAGDAYFYRSELDVEPYCTPGLRAYQTLMEKDRAARLQNQRRLRDLKQQHAGEVSITCAHDLVEFERLTARSHRVPASAADVSEQETSPTALHPGTGTAMLG